MSNIAIISMPSQEYNFPAPSIFFLKGALSKYGIESTCFDLNHAFMSKFKDDALYWCETGKSFKKEFDDFILDYSKQLANFDYLCLSVFTYNSQNFTRRFLELVRPMGHKIIIGGNGVENQQGENFNGSSQFFDQELINNNLVDVVIKNEGDNSLPNYFSGKSYNFDQLDDISDMAFSNFDDIDFKDYASKTVFINGSRGCVRKCSFCDVAYFWSKYRYRAGDKIAEEIVYHYNKYGVTNFAFSDSLVNGNMKEFRKFCAKLSEMKLPIKWEGQFIFRNGTTTQDWDNLKDSGCKRIWIGIESGSEKVRNDMVKKFDNVALYDSIKNCGERQIPMVFLLLVGYPTETLSDYEQTLDLIRWSEKYKDLIEIRVNPAMILPNTPLEKIDWHGTIENWKYFNSDGKLDFAERYRRWYQSNELALSLGFKIFPKHKEQKRFLDEKLKEYNET